MRRRLPASVLARLTGNPVAHVLTVVEHPLPGATGAATRALTRMTVEVEGAAGQLGEWQRTSTVPDVPWLGGHQLAQRLETSSLAWTSVDADPRAGRW